MRGDESVRRGEDLVFATGLRQVALKLDPLAKAARRRQMYGLQEQLEAAARSARSWAASIDEEG